jgi:hypothetical protein
MQAQSLEAKMQAQRLVQFGNQRRRQLSDAWPEASNVNGSDLFRLGFGRACQASCASFQQRLEHQDACHIRGHRYYGHHAATEARRPRICPVVAHEYYWASLVGFRAADRLQVSEANLAPPHDCGSASAVVGSHNSASPDCSHSPQASS